MTVVGRSDAARGRNGGPQRRLVGAQLRARGGAACLERAFDAILQAGQPTSDVTVDGRFAAVALELAGQPFSQGGSQGRADRRLHQRNVVAPQQEQRAAHRHPADQAAAPVHRLGHLGQRRPRAAGQHRQVHRRRVGGVQADHRAGRVLRTLGVAAQTVATHHGLPALLHRDRPHNPSFPANAMPGIIFIDTLTYRYQSVSLLS